MHPWLLPLADAQHQDLAEFVSIHTLGHLEVSLVWAMMPLLAHFAVVFIPWTKHPMGQSPQARALLIVVRKAFSRRKIIGSLVVWQEASKSTTVRVRQLCWSLAACSLTLTPSVCFHCLQTGAGAFTLNLGVKDHPQHDGLKTQAAHCCDQWSWSLTASYLISFPISKQYNFVFVTIEWMKTIWIN